MKKKTTRGGEFREPGFWETVKEAFLGTRRPLDCIQAEVTSRCPGRCTYCPHTTQREKWLSRDMDMETFGRLWPLMRRSGRVHLQGWGEPLLNPDAVLAACGALSDSNRFGLGQRHITVSTSGVIPGIERMTSLRRQYKLAVSLHAARPDLRDVLVPLNRKYPLDEVVAAATEYGDATGRRVTYEMVMIDGINDTAADAEAAAELLRGRLAHVNLIPMNPVAHTPWQPSSPERVEAFAVTLRAVGLHTTVRRNRGIEIGAACGQLAAERAGEPAPSAVQRRRDLIEQRSAAALVSEAAGADVARQQGRP